MVKKLTYFSVFEKHGAVPCEAKWFDSSLLDQWGPNDVYHVISNAGTVLPLQYNLRLPFIKTLSSKDDLTELGHFKRYQFGKVYRTGKTEASYLTGTPSEVDIAEFDIVEIVPEPKDIFSSDVDDDINMDFYHGSVCIILLVLILVYAPQQLFFSEYR